MPFAVMVTHPVVNSIRSCGGRKCGLPVVVEMRLAEQSPKK
jgi:hypothetical protein